MITEYSTALLCMIFVVIASIAGALTGAYLDSRRVKKAKIKKDRETLDLDRAHIARLADKILKGTALDFGDTLRHYRLDELPREVITIVQDLVLDLEVAHRISQEGSVQENLDIARQALEKIKNAASEECFEPEHEDIWKIASGALDTINGHSSVTFKQQ